MTWPHLVIKEPGKSDEKYFKDAGLEEGDLVVVMETLEARDELREGADLPNVVHEPLRKLLQDRIFRSTFHGTSLERKRDKI